MSEETMAWIAILLRVLSIGISVPLIVQTARGFRQLHREEREARSWTPPAYDREAVLAQQRARRGLR